MNESRDLFQTVFAKIVIIIHKCVFCGRKRRRKPSYDCYLTGANVNLTCFFHEAHYLFAINLFVVVEIFIFALRTRPLISHTV